MDRDELQSIVNIPKSVSVDRVISKNVLYQGLKSPKDKKIVRDSINKMIWLAAFKPSNTNILPFKNELENYPEVEIIFADIVDSKYMLQVFEIISKIIPYPLIMTFQCENKYQVFTAEYGIKKDDFLSINKIEKSPILDTTKLKSLFDFDWFSLQTINMKSFYESFKNKIVKLSINKTEKLKDNIDYGIVLDLQKQIEVLASEAKKEDQLNLKIDLLKQIKVKQNKLDSFYRG